MPKNNKLNIKHTHGDIMFKNIKLFHQKNFNFKDGKKQNIISKYHVYNIMVFII